MTKNHRDRLHRNRRLAQFKRAYVRALNGKCPWSKILFLRAAFKGFMAKYIKTEYPVPNVDYPASLVDGKYVPRQASMVDC